MAGIADAYPATKNIGGTIKNLGHSRRHWKPWIELFVTNCVIFYPSIITDTNRKIIETFPWK